MFRLHALLVDTLWKVRYSINKVIAGRRRSGRHPIKNASFDILSLANQLQRSKSTNFDGLERGKIYSSENQVPDLLMQVKAHLHTNIFSYNEGCAATRTFHSSLDRRSCPL